MLIHFYSICSKLFATKHSFIFIMYELCTHVKASLMLQTVESLQLKMALPILFIVIWCKSFAIQKHTVRKILT